MNIGLSQNVFVFIFHVNFIKPQKTNKNKQTNLQRISPKNNYLMMFILNHRYTKTDITTLALNPVFKPYQRLYKSTAHSIP